MSGVRRNRQEPKIVQARVDEGYETAQASLNWQRLTADDARKTAEWRERMKAQIAERK